MIKGPRHRKIQIGIVLMLIPYLLTMMFLFTEGPMERSRLGWVVGATVFGVVLQWVMILIGLWRRTYWTSGKFLLMFLVINAKMLICLIVLSSEIPWFLLTTTSAIFFAWFAMYHFAKLDKDFWKARPKWYKRILRIDTVPNWFLILCIAEMALRIYGWEPGEVFINKYFTRVSELVEKTDYQTDEDGIMVISEEGQRLAATGFWEGEFKKAYGHDSTFSGSVHSTWRHYRDLRQGNTKTEYSLMIDSLYKLDDSLLTDYDRALINTLKEPINRDGFRSVAFRNYPSKRKKVLLIGDSFTFGYSADGWTNSFADVLTTRGYDVFNAGITGTDPPQYLAVAKKYIPILQPDVVVTNIYLGNDVIHYRREVSPDYPIYYGTNAGVVMACPTSECISGADSVYQFYIRENYIAAGEHVGWLESFLSKSVIGTVFWKGMKYFGWLGRVSSTPNQAYWERNLGTRSEEPVTEEYLSGIEELCQESGAGFLCMVIPTNDDLQPDLDAKFPGLFKEMEYVLPSYEANHYDTGYDGHFNDQGHAYHAEILDSLIRKMQLPERVVPDSLQVLPEEEGS